jgi:hypothetical protein
MPGNDGVAESYDRGGILPQGTTVAVNATDAPESVLVADADDAYVCGPCQRTQHRRCDDPACTCCQGDP